MKKWLHLFWNFVNGLSLKRFPSALQTYHCPYTGCPRRNVPDFRRAFLTLKYTDITSKHLCPKLNGYGVMARDV
jgi:hypothetical protein